MMTAMMMIQISIRVSQSYVTILTITVMEELMKSATMTEMDSHLQKVIVTIANQM